jgi:hypothetical protein
VTYRTPFLGGTAGESGDGAIEAIRTSRYVLGRGSDPLRVSTSGYMDGKLGHVGVFLGVRSGSAGAYWL